MEIGKLIFKNRHGWIIERIREFIFGIDFKCLWITPDRFYSKFFINELIAHVNEICLRRLYGERL